MKQIFTKLGMIVAFMLSFFSASAYDFEVDGIYYTVTDLPNMECEVVKGDAYYEGEVIIPSTVTFNSKTLTVVGIGERAFMWCDSLTSVTIPNSVTIIGDSAFFGCSSLTSVKLSENLELIDYGTFEYCSKLESIEIPGSVKEIVQHRATLRYTFTDLKRLVLKYSADLLVSSFYSNNSYKNIETSWDSKLTETLEEVFFDRQMVYDMPLPNVKTLSFGEHLKEVQVKDIQNCKKLETIVCYGTEPPTLPECSNKQYLNTVVKVPQEALEKYQKAENWKNFWNLQGFDPSEAGVDEIPISTVEKVETGRYNLNGQRVGEDYRGVVIIRYSDGSTRKLISR